MPLYEFECGACGSIFEKSCSIVSTEVVPCTKCESTNTKKIMSCPGYFNLKGPGFYQNDYCNTKKGEPTSE